MSEGFPPDAFAEILTDPSRPLIVGGQAVNLWAEYYAASLPGIQQFAPFTSKDADIFGDRALAERLSQKPGWLGVFYSEPRQIAVGALLKRDSVPPLKIEVLRSVRGVTPKDLAQSAVVELAPGRTYRMPAPMVLLKAKLANVAEIGTDRPQDLKHAQMLVPITRAFLEDAHGHVVAGKIPERALVDALTYTRSVVTSSTARQVEKKHALNLGQVFPDALDKSPLEKVRNFARHQLGGDRGLTR